MDGPLGDRSTERHLIEDATSKPSKADGWTDPLLEIELLVVE